MAAPPALDEAMDRYAAGDAAAFAVVHAGLASRLRAFLLRLTGDASVADDLLQETFLRIHRARGSFARGAAAVPWAYAIARNAWLDHARAARYRRTVPVHPATDRDSDPGIDPGTGPDHDGEAQAIARQTAAVVEATLAKLPSSQREAFVLLRYERMSVEEAAEVLGATKTAVKLRAFRAYAALRAALGAGAPDGVAGERKEAAR